MTYNIAAYTTDTLDPSLKLMPPMERSWTKLGRSIGRQLMRLITAIHLISPHAVKALFLVLWKRRWHRPRRSGKGLLGLL